MNAEYQFAVGGIEEITNEKIKKVESMDNLNFPNKPNSIIIFPKIIGVYQEDREYPKKRGEFYDRLSQLSVLAETGGIEKISPNLICVAYDPTNISEDILKESVEDRMGRVKIVRYNELPDFYDKKIPGGLSILDMLSPESIDKSRTAVLQREKNIWELLRRDYGLTRMESIDLASIGVLLSRINKEPGVFSNPFSLKFGKDILGRFDNLGFGDFLR